MLRIAQSSSHHPLHAKRRRLSLPLGAGRFLAVLEGIEGGFAIGTAIVAALALSGIDRRLLFTTAIISIIVSGFNTASVKYSSEHYLDELDGREKKSPIKHYFMPSLIEFGCYVALSLVAIVPLLLITDVTAAVIASIVLTLAMLFAAGLFRGYMLRSKGLRDGLETMLLGAGIIIVGVLSGLVVHSL